MGFGIIDPTPQYMRNNLSDLHDPKTAKDTVLRVPIDIYWQTGIVVIVMIFISNIIESHGFFGVLWGIIKGVFVGILGGVFWPILFFDISNIWFILYPMVGSILFTYYSYFYQEKNQKFFIQG
jgi:hypothetical protein